MLGAAAERVAPQYAGARRPSRPKSVRPLAPPPSGTTAAPALSHPSGHGPRPLPVSQATAAQLPTPPCPPARPPATPSVNQSAAGPAHPRHRPAPPQRAVLASSPGILPQLRLRLSASAFVCGLRSSRDPKTLGRGRRGGAVELRHVRVGVVLPALLQGRRDRPHSSQGDAGRTAGHAAHG